MLLWLLTIFKVALTEKKQSYPQNKPQLSGASNPATGFDELTLPPADGSAAEEKSCSLNDRTLPQELKLSYLKALSDTHMSGSLSFTNRVSGVKVC